MIGAIAGAAGSAIAYACFKNDKTKKIASATIFFVIFIGTKYFLVPYYQAATLDSTLKEYPLYNVIATYYPKEYNTYLEQMKKNAVENGSVENRVGYSTTLIDFATAKSLPNAASKDIFNYLKANYELEKKLYAENPLFVIAIEFPDRMEDKKILSSLISAMPEENSLEVMKTQARLIESGSNASTPLKLSAEEIKKGMANIQAIMIELKNKYGDEPLIDTFVNTTVIKDPEKSAEIILDFYERLLATGEESASLMYRIAYMHEDGEGNREEE